MIRKALALLLITWVIIIFVGCGVNDDESELNDETLEEVEEELEEAPVEEEEEVMPEDEGRLSVGDVRETEEGEFTLKAVKYDVLEKNVGPAITAINHVKAVSADIRGDLAQFLEQDELEYISIDISVENTSEEDIIYYAGQAQIVTDTGEQLHSDMFLSDHIEGEMRAGAKQTGSLIYVLEQSNAEDVNSVRIIINEPQDMDWNIIGEEIDIEVDIS